MNNTNPSDGQKPNHDILKAQLKSIEDHFKAEYQKLLENGTVFLDGILTEANRIKPHLLTEDLQLRIDVIIDLADALMSKKSNASKVLFDKTRSLNYKFIDFHEEIEKLKTEYAEELEDIDFHTQITGNLFFISHPDLIAVLLRYCFKSSLFYKELKYTKQISISIINTPTSSISIYWSDDAYQIPLESRKESLSILFHLIEFMRGTYHYITVAKDTQVLKIDLPRVS